MDENPENTSQSDQTPQESTPPPPEPSATDTGQTPVVSQNARNMALLCHLLGFFTKFIGPLIIWLIKKDEDAYIDQQGKEALNFQITVFLGYAISGALVPIFCLGGILGTVVFICDLVFVIMACVTSSKGQAYRYPVSIRLIK